MPGPNGAEPDPLAEPVQLELVADAGGAFVVHDPGPSTRNEIRRLHASGLTYTDIARDLNERGVPTPSGRGVWHRQTVERHDKHEEWAEYMRQRRERERRRGVT
jgi:hypothetical protein